MIPNDFIDNSSYAKKEQIKMEGNYPLFSHLGTPNNVDNLHWQHCGSIHYEIIKDKEENLCQLAK